MFSLGEAHKPLGGMASDAPRDPLDFPRWAPLRANSRCAYTHFKAIDARSAVGLAIIHLRTCGCGFNR